MGEDIQMLCGFIPPMYRSPMKVRMIPQTNRKMNRHVVQPYQYRYTLEKSTYEPPRGKTNNVVFEQVRHKLTCTVTEKS